MASEHPVTGSSHNQTQSFLIRRFAEVGLRPQARRGQSFLVDLNLLRLLVDTAQLGPQDVVLEVGTGTGSLTALIAQRAAHVVTVEIDRHLFQMASEELSGLANVTMLHLDALRNKNHLHPDLPYAVQTLLDAAPSRAFKFVANLPYQVATPVLTNLLAGRPVPRTLTVTIQKEVADRLAARPATKDYGALSIWVQCQCRVEIVRIMPPTVFWPRPQVDSAIVQLTVDDALRARVPDPEFFHRFVRSIFLHRRKLLRSGLESAFKGRLSKQEADALLARLALAPTARAEELDVPAMIALAEAVRAQVGE